MKIVNGQFNFEVCKTLIAKRAKFSFLDNRSIWQFNFKYTSKIKPVNFTAS